MKALFKLFFIALCFIGTLSAQNYFFYSFNDSPWTFNRRNSDGTSPITVYTPPYGNVYSSAEDGSINKAYYYDNATNSSLTQAAIIKSNYDGSGASTLLSINNSTNLILNIAAGNGYVYYAYSKSPYTIRRINADGTGDTQIYYNPNYGIVYKLAVDIANKYLYFYEFNYDGVNNRIAWTDLDGNNLTTVYTTTARINCLAAGNNYFFFAPSESPWTFRRRNSDGTNEKVIYTPSIGQVQSCSYSEALNKIYFYVDTPRAVYVANIDGSNRTTLYSGFTQKIASLSTPKENNPLPVELTSFVATDSNDKIMLKWQTATEVNNYGFDVERKSLNNKNSGNNWAKIGFVRGNGNSNSVKKYSFRDSADISGKYEYRLKQIDTDGKYKYSKDVKLNVNFTPKQFSLAQNYPNPFNPSTTIEYSIPKRSMVTIKVYDLMGRQIQTLVNSEKSTGDYTVQFNANKYSSGIYFYTLKAGHFIQTKKLILLK